MNFCSSFEKIPAGIRTHLAEANMFYTQDYENNVKYRGQSVLYVWSGSEIIVVRIRERFVFRVAILDTEPFPYNSNKEEISFIDEVMMTLENYGVKWTFTNTTARFQSYPIKASVVPSGDYIIDLTKSEEELWSNVHSKHRNSIRRGEKDELELIMGGIELLDDYVPLSNETYERSNVNDGGFDYYRGLIEGLGKYSLIMLVKNQEGVQSGGMFYFNKSMAYYVHGASVRRPSPGATNYLLWKAAMFFKEKGVKKFSFVGYHYYPEEGSKLDGIQRFKERFGGPLEPCFNFKYVQNKFIYRLYCIIMQLKSNQKFSKYQDSIDKQIAQHHYTEFNKA